MCLSVWQGNVGPVGETGDKGIAGCPGPTVSVNFYNNAQHLNRVQILQ